MHMDIADKLKISIRNYSNAYKFFTSSGASELTNVELFNVKWHFTFSDLNIKSNNWTMDDLLERRIHMRYRSHIRISISRLRARMMLSLVHTRPKTSENAIRYVRTLSRIIVKHHIFLEASLDDLMFKCPGYILPLLMTSSQHHGIEYSPSASFSYTSSFSDQANGNNSKNFNR